MIFVISRYQHLILHAPCLTCRPALCRLPCRFEGSQPDFGRLDNKADPRGCCHHQLWHGHQSGRYTAPAKRLQTQALSRAANQPGALVSKFSMMPLSLCLVIENANLLKQDLQCPATQPGADVSRSWMPLDLCPFFGNAALSVCHSKPDAADTFKTCCLALITLLVLLLPQTLLAFPCFLLVPPSLSPLLSLSLSECSCI